MKNDSSSSTSSKCKCVVLLAFLLIVIEITVVHRWESLYTVTSSVGGFNLVTKWRHTSENQNNTNEDSRVLNTTHNTTQFTTAVVTTSSSQSSRTGTLIEQTNNNSSETTSVELELKRRLQNATNKKVILVWIPMFGVKNQENIDAEKCGNCEVTYDRGRINDENTGALIFHFDALRANNMPPTRNLSQLYVYWDLESTATLRTVRGQSLNYESNFKFNATMNYRRDSEFYMSYEKSTPSEIIKENHLKLDELLKMKTKSALAIVSNCGYTPGARTRMKMLRELMGLGLNMEGYGGCFKGGKFVNGQGRLTDAYHTEVRKYKFYFSFENSCHCKDYITEKFFNNALRSLSVPVVWGAKKIDYEAVAPPGSFIFVEDFASMKDLADYLKYLMGNDTAYLEYLRWLTMKPSDMPQYGRARGWCHICRALHGINTDDVYNPKYNETNPIRPLFTDGVAQRTIPNLIDWFYGEDNPECFKR